MLAAQVLGSAHAHDGLVLAAVRALRDQLVAPQAIDAAVAARQLGRSQPRLAAARARRAFERDLSPFRRHGSGPSRVTAGAVLTAQPGDEEPIRMVAIRPRLQETGVAASGELSEGGAEVVGPHPAIAPEQRGDRLLVLADGDRAGCVDERAAGAQGAGGLGEDRILRSGEAGDQLWRLPPPGI